MTRWNESTDVAVHRRAERVLKQFDWDLQARFEHLDDTDLRSDDYLDKILEVMSLMVGERSGDELRRSMRAALYETERAREETVTQYVARREQQFLKAQLHGIEVPSSMRGLMLEEGASLSKQGRQNLRTLTAGSTEWKPVAHALRSLDIQEERMLGPTSRGSGGAFLATDLEEEEAEDDCCNLDSGDDEVLLATVEELNVTEEDLPPIFAVIDSVRRKSWT